MRWRLKSWVHKTGEEIAPWVGLSLGLLYLVAVVGMGLAAVHVQRAELNAQHRSGLQRWSWWLAQNVGRVRGDSPQAAGREIRRAGREPGVAFCATVSSAGVFTTHSDPAKIGKPAPKLITDGEDGAVQLARDPNRQNETVFVVRLPAAKGETAEELWVAAAPPPFSWRNSDLVFWLGHVLLAVMILFLIAYRSLRRAVQPLAVIRRRLMGCEQPLADRLVALRLNDSFDEISTSWNRLIEFVSQMQEELRRSRLATDVTAAMDGYRSERLTGILMQIPFGVLVVEREGAIAFANRAAAGMLGSSVENIEGVDIGQFFEEGLRLSLLADNKAARSGHGSIGRWTDHTFRRAHGDITLRFWSVSGSESGDEHILFIQDVTQAKEAERARDHFLYHVTHELRTPLTNIRAYAETLSQGVLDDEQTIRECYNVIMGETQRLNRLVEDILNVSQLEVGTARLEVGAVQLDKLLRGVVQDVQGSADSKNIDLVLSLPAKVPQLRGDKERLAVVLTNLVGNAVKYTPSGGRIDVRCTADGSRARITVTDTGIGIRPEDQEKIFEKFFRVDDERVSALPGTGLGLAIVKETVRLHGGAVFVESTPGKGSTFTVVLPSLSLEGETTADGGQAASDGSAAASTRSGGN